MKWVHLNNYKPEIDGAIYAVSDGDMVGVGVWDGQEFDVVFLDDEDLMDLNGHIEPKDFVFWEHLNVLRFGVHKLDTNQKRVFKLERGFQNLINKIEKES